MNWVATFLNILGIVKLTTLILASNPPNEERLTLQHPDYFDLAALQAVLSEPDSADILMTANILRLGADEYSLTGYNFEQEAQLFQVLRLDRPVTRKDVLRNFLEGSGDLGSMVLFFASDVTGWTKQLVDLTSCMTPKRTINFLRKLPRELYDRMFELVPEYKVYESDAAPIMALKSIIENDFEAFHRLLEDRRNALEIVILADSLCRDSDDLAAIAFILDDQCILSQGFTLAMITRDLTFYLQVTIPANNSPAAVEWALTRALDFGIENFLEEIDLAIVRAAKGNLVELLQTILDFMYFNVLERAQVEDMSDEVEAGSFDYIQASFARAFAEAFSIALTFSSPRIALSIFEDFLSKSSADLRTLLEDRIRIRMRIKSVMI